MPYTNRLTSILNLLAELAIVEERSVSIRHMSFDHHRRYSEYHTADSQWYTPNRVQDFDLESGKSIVLRTTRGRHFVHLCRGISSYDWQTTSLPDFHCIFPDFKCLVFFGRKGLR